jgi:hypothetical protein
MPGDSVCLVVLDDGVDANRRVFPLYKSVYTVGIYHHHDVVLSGPGVNRDQCEVEREGNEFWIRDLGGRRDTYVGEKKLQPGERAPVATGVLIRAGRVLLQLIPRNSSCLDSDVLAIAQAISDERAFDRLSILADALEDAGCTDNAILEHCRGPGPHVRGCWVVDLLLGKN